MGISPDNFASLTPDEFGEIVKARTEREKMLERSEWERTRTLATLLLQPYSKKKLKPDDILRLESDKTGKGKQIVMSTPERM